MLVYEFYHSDSLHVVTYPAMERCFPSAGMQVLPIYEHFLEKFISSCLLLKVMGVHKLISLCIEIL